MVRLKLKQSTPETPNKTVERESDVSSMVQSIEDQQKTATAPISETNYKLKATVLYGTLYKNLRKTEDEKARSTPPPGVGK